MSSRTLFGVRWVSWLVSQTSHLSLWASVTALSGKQWGWSHRGWEKIQLVSTNTQCSNPLARHPHLYLLEPPCGWGPSHCSCDSQTSIFLCKPCCPTREDVLLPHLIENGSSEIVKILRNTKALEMFPKTSLSASLLYCFTSATKKYLQTQPKEFKDNGKGSNPITPNPIRVPPSHVGFHPLWPPEVRANLPCLLLLCTEPGNIHSPWQKSSCLLFKNLLFGSQDLF